MTPPEKKKVVVKKVVKKVIKKVIKRPEEGEEVGTDKAPVPVTRPAAAPVPAPKKAPMDDMALTSKPSKYKSFTEKEGDSAPSLRPATPVPATRPAPKEVEKKEEGMEPEEILEVEPEKEEPKARPPARPDVSTQRPQAQVAPASEPIAKSKLMDILAPKKKTDGPTPSPTPEVKSIAPVKEDAKGDVEVEGEEEKDIKGDEELDNLEIPELAEGFERSILETLDAKVEDLLEDIENGLDLSEDLDTEGGTAPKVEEKDAVEMKRTAPSERMVPRTEPAPGPAPTHARQQAGTETRRRSKERMAAADKEEEIEGVSVDDTLRERRVAYKLAQNFNKLPINMRNELIKTLSKVEDIKVREDVVSAIGEHFGDLPKELRNLILDLAKDPETRIREEVAFEVDRSFNNFSSNIRESILLELSKDSEAKVREDVVGVICKHYNELSAPVKDKLVTLSKDPQKSVRDEVEFYLSKSDVELPDSVKAALMKNVKS